MMRTLAYILILMMAIAWNGCSSEPSAIDRLKKGYDDRINGLRLPVRPDPGGKETPKPDQTQNLPTQKKTSPGMDLSSLPGQKKFTVEPLIVVMEEKVPLYNGTFSPVTTTRGLGAGSLYFGREERSVPV